MDHVVGVHLADDPQDDQGERGRLFMHELFHSIQLARMGADGSGRWRPRHLDSLEGALTGCASSGGPWRGALGASGAARTSRELRMR